MLFEKEMEERSENSCESSRTRTAIGSGYVHRHRPTALVRHVAGMLLPGAPGDQGRPDHCAANRITHIGAKNLFGHSTSQLQPNELLSRPHDLLAISRQPTKRGVM